MTVPIFLKVCCLQKTYKWIPLNEAERISTYIHSKFDEDVIQISKQNKHIKQADYKHRN